MESHYTSKNFVQVLVLCTSTNITFLRYNLTILGKYYMTKLFIFIGLTNKTYLLSTKFSSTSTMYYYIVLVLYYNPDYLFIVYGNNLFFYHMFFLD